MSTTEIIVLVVVLLVVAAIVAALMAQAKKRKRLQSKFGSEYDRTVESSDRRRDAERELTEREQRRQSLDIRPLPAEDRRMFSDRWRSTQEDFVDHPEMAVRQADLLVAEVMGRRGYPVGDFDQMSRDVSVDHAGVVHEYRAAHEISELNDRKQASTEQLRQAMVHYRALFTDLLSDSDDDDRSRTRSPSDLRSDRDDRPTTYDDDRLVTDRPTTHDDGYTSDHDRDRDSVRTERPSETSDRIDTSRADGVRVEPGGLDRPRAEDRDRPRG